MKQQPYVLLAGRNTTTPTQPCQEYIILLLYRDIAPRVLVQIRRIVAQSVALTRALLSCYILLSHILTR